MCAPTHSPVSHIEGVSEGLRLIRDITSLVDEQARGYIASLQNLRHSLLGQAGTVAAVMVYRVFDKLEVIGKPTSPTLTLL